jgi:hypothetical protein
MTSMTSGLAASVAFAALHGIDSGTTGAGDGDDQYEYLGLIRLQAACREDSSLSAADRRSLMLQHAIATRALALKALLALRADAHVAACPPVELGPLSPSIAQHRLRRAVPRLAQQVAGESCWSLENHDEPTTSSSAVAAVAGTSLAGLFDATRRTLAATAAVAPLANARLGAEVPPGQATMSVARQAQEAANAAEFARRTTMRRTCRWLCTTQPMLRDAGLRLVPAQSTAKGGSAAGLVACDDRGAATLEIRRVCRVEILCGEGAPQLLRFTSLLRAPAPAAAPSPATSTAAADEASTVLVVPSDPSHVVSEINSAFHSRGSRAGLMALRAVASALLLQAVAETANGLKGQPLRPQVGSSASAYVIDRVASDATVECSVRLFVRPAGGSSSAEGLIALEVDRRSMAIRQTATRTNGVRQPTSDLHIPPCPLGGGEGFLDLAAIVCAAMQPVGHPRTRPLVDG